MKTEEFPSIFLPWKIGARVRFPENWAEVRYVEDLPSRLFVGDIVRETFIKSEDSWSVEYGDKAGFWMTLQMKDGRVQIEEYFQERSLMQGFAPKGGIGKEILSSIIRDPHSHGAALKTFFGERYNLTYLPNQHREEIGITSYIPDGFMLSAVIPVPFTKAAFGGIIRAFTELNGCPITLGPSSLRIGLVAVNFIQGRCDNVPLNEIENMLWMLDRGFLPAAVPKWEDAVGSRALTARCLSYILRATFPMYHASKIIKVLHSNGVVADSNGSALEQMAFLGDATELHLAENVSAGTKDSSRRVFLQLSRDGELPIDRFLEGSQNAGQSLAEVDRLLAATLCDFENRRSTFVAAIKVRIADALRAKE
jgi:hypothetical protein